MLRLLAAVLLTASAAAQPTAYVGGRWAAFDDESVRFEPRDTTWADGGVFVSARPELSLAQAGGAPRVVELGDAFVVPPYGDAHYHGLDDPGGLAAADGQFVAGGVFYVQNPNNLRSDRDRVRGLETVADVVYAGGGITAPGAHPVPTYERQALGLSIQEMWDRADELRESRRLDGDAYHLALTAEDLDAVWPRVLAGRPDLVKVYLLGSEEWNVGTPERPKGLSPNVVAEVVRRAHAAGLRVVAHVETAADVRAALDAEVDGLAHVPGYNAGGGSPESAYVLDDALVAELAARRVPVTPTFARGPAQLPFVPERYRPSAEVQAAGRRFHRDTFRRLAAAGVPLALGADLGTLTVHDEARYAVEIGGLTPSQALRALAVETPRAVFPDRAVGALGPGFEASLLVLGCDPTADWACATRIRHREKSGRAVGRSELTAAAGAPRVPRRNPDAAPTAYIGGRWFDGERFVRRDTTWAERGVFVAQRPARVARTVRLGERYVVHPFGDAHTHQLASRRGIRIAARYRDEGIFFVQVLTNPARSARAVRDTFATAASLDVAYAHGGITTTESHPHGVYEGLALGAYTRQQQVEMADAIRTGRQEEGNAYWFMDTLADVEAAWDAYLATEPDVVKIYVMGVADPDSQPTDRRGLRPEVVREVVRRAHAAGLPVWAHVETARDVALVTAAGADGLAHLPGYSFARDEARYALPDSTVRAMGARGMAVAPTAMLLPRYTGDRPARRALGQMLQRTTLRRLHDAGVDVVIGADGYGLTSTPEAAYLHALGVFPPATLLGLWSRATPRAIFPRRALGRLAPGHEASLLALACDPTADWSCTARIEHREKQGVPLPPSDAE